MAVPETTQRRIGFAGTANCGTTLNGSDIWGSADIEEWEADIETTSVDMTGGNEFRQVSQITRQKCSGTIVKMVAASPEFIERALTNPVVYLELRLGSNINATVGAGDVIFEGLAILDTASLKNAKHDKVLENIRFTFSGDYTPA